MTFELPPLPYEKSALEPYISAETLEYHHGKHHRAYVNNLNKLIQGTEFAQHKLEEIICNSSGPIFNNAAQVWNHTFYWHCLRQNGGKEPTGQLEALLERRFGSFASFQKELSDAALSNFGSGWSWLIKKKSGQLEIVNTANAECPITQGDQPLLTVDIWEHAYYIDYRNVRADYISAFWQLVNWEFVAQNLSS